MLENIRTQTTTPYLAADASNSRVLPVMMTPGTERPDAQNPNHAVQAVSKSAASTRPADHADTSETKTTELPPTDERRNTERAAKGEDAERTDDDKSAQQSTEEALKDPTSEVYKTVQELAARDKEVRTHEQAHLAAAGQYATSGPRYSFQTGPDGKRYAIGGEVGIDTAVVPDDPLATVSKMQTVQRAAMAPAEPSAQDMRVAADAAQKAAHARMEIMRNQLEAQTGSDGEDTQAVSDDEATPTDGETNTPETMSVTAMTAVEAYQRTAEDPSPQMDLAA